MRRPLCRWVVAVMFLLVGNASAQTPPSQQLVIPFENTTHEPRGYWLAEGSAVRFRFSLAGGSLVSPVAALVFDTPSGVAPYDRLAFTIRAK